MIFFLKRFEILNFKFEILILSCLQSIEKLFILPAQRLFFQQIGPVVQCLFQRFLSAPAANLFVVAAHQHFGNAHAAKLRGARVMRIIEQSAGNVSEITIASGRTVVIPIALALYVTTLPVRKALAIALNYLNNPAP